MTRSEWKVQFKKLCAKFPTFKFADEAAVSEAYWEELKDFQVPQMASAVREVISSGGEYFPSLSRIKQLCDYAKCMEGAPRYPNANFLPINHGCGLEKTRIDIANVRRMLFMACPYEAVHVLCKGEFSVLCPWCGTHQSPFINTFIEKIIQLHPEHTKGWNPYHKGTALCAVCDKLKYPEDFLAQRAS